MRKLIPWLIAALCLAAGAIGITKAGTTVKPVPVPVTVPAPQLKDHPCTAAHWYMQCAITQPGTLSLAPGIRPQVTNGSFGIDFAWGGPSGYFAAGHGARFGCSYLSDTSKDWSYALLHGYANAGGHACFVWESSQYRALSGYSAGYADARAASAEAARLGAPGVRIYFAYDFDTSLYSCRSICPYLEGADAAIGKARVGDYGGLNTVRTAFNAGVISGAWQTLAWSYGQWDPRACIRQVGINDRWYGYSTDFDYVVCANNGLWPAPKPPPPPRLCYHHRESVARCASVKREVATFRRELNTDAWRLWWETNYQKHSGCRIKPPFRLRGCRAVYNLRNQLAYDVAWLKHEIPYLINHN